MGSYKLFLTTGILMSIAIIITALAIVRQRFIVIGKAGSQNVLLSSTFSANNSYIFATPISASADGDGIIRIQIFLLNNQGLGIGGQNIKLTASSVLTVNPVQPITDIYGKAIFDVSTSTSGDYTIKASVSGRSLPATALISFR